MPASCSNACTVVQTGKAMVLPTKPGPTDQVSLGSQPKPSTKFIVWCSLAARSVGRAARRKPGRSAPLASMPAILPRVSQWMPEQPKELAKSAHLPAISLAHFGFAAMASTSALPTAALPTKPWLWNFEAASPRSTASACTTSHERPPMSVMPAAVLSSAALVTSRCSVALVHWAPAGGAEKPPRAPASWNSKMPKSAFIAQAACSGSLPGPHSERKP
mmetsp:Transcript_68041/g.190562  ORF Transcript_68041/g.190562 Transcript_68041/m.190562 type:complete len:218 (-) Transcript_68041:232-885(-)